MSSLDHSPADIVRFLLIELGVGSEPVSDTAWPIFVSNTPDLPDNLITLIDTSGVIDGRIMRTGEVHEHYGLSVQVRGTGHTVAWQKMNQVKTALDESVLNSSVTIDNSNYMVHSVSRRSGPLALGREAETDRFLFTFNVIVALMQYT